MLRCGTSLTISSTKWRIILQLLSASLIKDTYLDQIGFAFFSTVLTFENPFTIHQRFLKANNRSNLTRFSGAFSCTTAHRPVVSVLTPSGSTRTTASFLVFLYLKLSLPGCNCAYKAVTNRFKTHTDVWYIMASWQSMPRQCTFILWNLLAPIILMVSSCLYQLQCTRHFNNKFA